MPGDPGDTPVLNYSIYTRDNGSFKLASGVDTYSWQSITENSAQYELKGETTYFDWDENDGPKGRITQTDAKGGPEESKLNRPLTPLIDNIEDVTSTEGGVTLNGNLMVFEPKTRTISVPDTNDTIEANNAIMLVQKAALFPDGSGLVSVEHYVPNVGPVAQTVYIQCPDIADLVFTDDADYYERQCASAFDQSMLLKSE